MFFKVFNLLSLSKISLFLNNSCTLLFPQKLPLKTASPFMHMLPFTLVQLNKGVKYASGSGYAPVQSNMTASKAPSANCL